MRVLKIAIAGAGIFFVAACGSTMTLESFAQGTWECTTLSKMAYEQGEDPEQWEADYTLTADEIVQEFDQLGRWEVMIEESAWAARFLPASTLEGQEQAEGSREEPTSGSWQVTSEGLNFTEYSTGGGYYDSFFNVLGVPQESPKQFTGPVDLVQSYPDTSRSPTENALNISWSDDVLNIRGDYYFTACRKA